MATTARLDLSVWRNDDVYEFPLRVRGIDLTDISMAMHVRLAPDTPGPPLFALAKVDNGNAEGLRVAGVSIVDGIPESDLRIRINRTTRQALPYAGELGDATRLAYALVLSGKTRMVGAFILLASTYASDNAPADRTTGSYTSSGGVPVGHALLTITQDDGATLTVEGLDTIIALTAEAKAAIDEVAYQSEVSAMITQVIAGAPAALPVDGNPNEITLIGDVPAVGSSFSALITQTNTGATYLTRGGLRLLIANGGGQAIGGGGLPAGSVADLTYSPGGIFQLDGIRSISTADALVPVNRQLTTVGETAEQLVGAPIAYPVNGNPNELTVPSLATPAINATFDAAIVATNTGTAFMTVGDVRLRISNGGGESIPAGGLPEYQIASFTRGGGGAYVLNSLRPMVEPPKPIWSRHPDILRNTWGVVNFDGAGNRTVTPKVKTVLAAGSSNNLASYIIGGQETDTPGRYFSDQLRDLTPGDGLVYQCEKVAVAGTPFSSIIDQLKGSQTFMANGATYLLLLEAMNSGRPGFYHGLGGIEAQMAKLDEAITLARDHDVEPIVFTLFEPDPRANADATFFEDQAPQLNMDFPASKAAPISSENHMEPRASQQLEKRDYTGSGILRTGYKRYWDMNRRIRAVAAKRGAMLADVHWASFRYVREPLPDLGVELEAYYKTGDPGGSPFHGTLLMAQTATHRVLREIAHHVTDGRSDQHVFRGQGV